MMLLKCGVREDFLRVPWTARRSNQSIQKEISLEYSLEGLMLKLKLQYIGHLMQRTNSLQKTLMLGKIEGGRSRRRERMRWLDGITDSMDMGLRLYSESQLTKKMADFIGTSLKITILSKSGSQVLSWIRDGGR